MSGDEELSTVEEPIQKTHVSVSHYNLICYMCYLCEGIVDIFKMHCDDTNSADTGKFLSCIMYLKLIRE